MAKSTEVVVFALSAVSSLALSASATVPSEIAVFAKAARQTALATSPTTMTIRQAASNQPTQRAGGERTVVAELTAADIAMLERAARRGVDYLDFDPGSYDDDE